MKTLLLCLLSLGVFGQSTVRPGLRAGANFSQITRTYYESRTDFYVGGYAEVRLTDLFRLQPEIGFSRQGASGDVYRLPQAGDSEEDKDWFRKNIESNYVTVGMTGKLAFSEAVRMLFGVSAEYALEMFKPLRKDVDVAFLTGLEYKLPFGLGVEVRVKRGTFDMIDSREYETFSGTRSSWFTIDRNLNLVLQTGLNYTLK